MESIHCDYCLNKRKSLSNSDHKRIHEIIHYELKKGPRLPEDLTKLFAHHEISLLEEIIREMTDRDELIYDTMGRLVWKQE